MANKTILQLDLFSGVMDTADLCAVWDASASTTKRIARDDLFHQPKMKFQTGLAKPAHDEGLLFYDEGEKSLAYYIHDPEVTMNIGQENWIRAVNNTGGAVVDGMAVRINGSSNGLPTIGLADNTSQANSACVGLTTSSGAQGANVVVAAFGLVRPIDTSAWTTGTTLWLSAVAGGLTSTQPSGATPQVRIGFVTVSSATVGRILVVLDRIR